MRAPCKSWLLVAGIACGWHLPTVAAATHPPTVSSPAFVAAAAAYKSFAGGDYATAVAEARRAVQLAQDNRPYRLLLVNSLAAAGRDEEADQAISAAIDRAGDDGKLAAQREPIRRRLAAFPGAAAFAALERRDFAAAVNHARAAVKLAPQVMVYRMVLVHALLQADQFSAADLAAGEAIAINRDDPSPQVLQAYAWQRLGRRDEARVSFESAIQMPGLSAAAQRNIRLIAADAAMAAGEARLAFELVREVPDDADGTVVLRRRLARTAMAEGRTTAMVTVGAWPPPSLDCREADGPQRCAVLAAIPRDPAHAIATLAYQAFAANDFPRASIEARRAVAYAPDNREYALLLVNALYRAGQLVEAEQAADEALAIDREDAALVAQRGFIRQQLGKKALARGDFDSALRLGGLPVNTEIGLLADLGRKADARRRFDAARVDGSLVKLAPAELAYLAARAGDDEQALAAFDRADAAGSLPGSAYQDAAYAALRARRDAQAIAYFRRSLEDTEPLQLRAETQLHFNTRRAISEVSREGGVIASLSYRGAVSGLGPTSASRTGSDSLQAGIEGYWRPWGYLNGRPVELFARAFQTLYTRGDGATGGDTLQSAVGIRRKLLADINLVASLSRVFTPSGRRDDWLAQLGYSGGTGGDLRVDAPSWWTSRISAEAGRYFIARQSYALASIEAGRTFRPDADAAWTVFPHLVIAGDYDSAAEVKRAFGIGPGIGWRYWFRADQYHAPRSYFDVTLDYRFRIRGAERERGLFLVGTLSY